MFVSALIGWVQPETSFKDEKVKAHHPCLVKSLRRIPAPLNMPSIRPDRDGIGDGVLLRAKIFGEDQVAVPNDESGSQNTPTSGQGLCASP